MDKENLFAYGTLMCPDILETVITEKHSGFPALLSEYSRFRVSREHYPGIIPIVGGEVQGVLFTDISLEALKVLDIFEGELYRRSAVHVLSANFGRFRAFTYVVQPQYRSSLTTEIWHPDYLTSERHESFTSRYAGFARTKNG